VKHEANKLTKQVPTKIPVKHEAVKIPVKHDAKIQAISNSSKSVV
jgi:hypothetical protein